MLLYGTMSGGIAIALIAFGWICIFSISTVSHFTASFFLVLRMPGRGLFVLPFSVAGDGVKYLQMSSGFMSGMPLNWSLLMAFRRMAGGKLKNV